MARTYYTLITRDWDNEAGEMGPWSPQFGDYDRETVQDEREEYLNEYSSRDVKIIMSKDDQASINARVAKENDWRK